MTVFKDVRTLVKDAISAAVALLQDQTPTAKRFLQQRQGGCSGHSVPVISVDKENVKTELIVSGCYQAADFTGLDAPAEPAADNHRNCRRWK
ncbi:MAG: hypothetical protein U0401_08370 [Anaerolineae bacterium]